MPTAVVMPVGRPSAGGPVGRSRMRISASGLVTWKRCPRQWFLGSKLGLRGAIVPEMVLGIQVEDALVGLLMESPTLPDTATGSRYAAWSRDEIITEAEKPTIESLDDLRTWIHAKVEDATKAAIERGAEAWESAPSKVTERDWSEMDAEHIGNMIRAGLDLFLIEVAACHTENGGPNLHRWREHGDPHSTPSPSWANHPCFPLPEKVPGISAPGDDLADPTNGFADSGPITWVEAWEIARPWVKDCRVWQPQRLYHPAGWAAGELDLVLRWRGKSTLVDIKASAGSSGYTAGLFHQLRFYRLLWEDTHHPDEVASEVDGLEGWYLGNGGFRKPIEMQSEDELNEFREETHAIWKEMTAADAEPETWPAAEPSAWLSHVEGEAEQPEDIEASKDKTCSRCSSRFYCERSPHEIKQEALSEILPERWSGLDNEQVKHRLQPRSPAKPLSEIRSRINVLGKVGGRWGPLSNHYGEPVHGGMVTTGGSANAILEEMAPGSFPGLRDFTDGEHVITDVAPGQWRQTTRLYLDSRSGMSSLEDWEGEPPQITRLGLIQTSANVDGLVVARSKNSGMRVDGKPWSMVTSHLWDGDRVIEFVAFGYGITETLSELQVGDRVLVVGAELGWRAGMPQLRVNPRNTRIEVVAKDWHPPEGHPASLS